jgi:hypothetical protein
VCSTPEGMGAAMTAARDCLTIPVACTSDCTHRDVDDTTSVPTAAAAVHLPDMVRDWVVHGSIRLSEIGFPP